MYKWSRGIDRDLQSPSAAVSLFMPRNDSGAEGATLSYFFCSFLAAAAAPVGRGAGLKTRLEEGFCHYQCTNKMVV